MNAVPNSLLSAAALFVAVSLHGGAATTSASTGATASPPSSAGATPATPPATSETRVTPATRTAGPAAAPAPAPEPTHVSLVVDMSGSMRSHLTDRLYPAVVDLAAQLLASNATAKFFQIVDSDGRIVSGPARWQENTEANRLAAITALATNRQDNISDPTPGLATALRSLEDPNVVLFICVIGDELAAPTNAIASRVARMNPPGPDGRPRATIHAVLIPTLAGMSPAVTQDSPAKFAETMAQIADESGGVFISMPESTFKAANAAR